MKCHSCARRSRGKQAPRGWSVCGRKAFCRRCRRRKYRLRKLTMEVAEAIGGAWEELWEAVTWSVRVGLWQASISAGEPLVRVSIAERLWTLRVSHARWSRARTDAYRMIASGEAAAGELLLSRGRHPDCLVCKTVVWLPRAAPAPARLSVPESNLEQTAIHQVRDAIRANRVSFPAQVPTFPTCGFSELQTRMVDLYFVLGWNVSGVAARYGLSHQQVRRMLNEWKVRAVRAGYIERVSPLIERLEDYPLESLKALRGVLA